MANMLTLTDDEWAWLWVRLDRSTECWLWTGMKSQGYGRMRVFRDGHRLSVGVHRMVHERMIGPIPDGYEVDHLCKVTNCANPAHLQAVTGHTNNMRSDSLAARRARQVTCHNGHLLAGPNVYFHPQRGTRDCRQCRRDRDATKRLARNLAA